MFYTCAKSIVENGGLAVGAVFDRGFKVRHRVVAEEELKSLCRSKYVQSDIQGIFFEVKDLLESGRQIIFSGTPCQIEGLGRYLKREYDNLLTCELFCYGTPDRIVYEQYLSYLETKYGAPIVSVNFKDKRYGWDYYTTCVRFANGREHCVFGGDSYSRLMRLGYSLTLGCLHCERSYRTSGADMVLGDFYTYSRYLMEQPPKNGISCVIVNSEKGAQLLYNTNGLKLLEINQESFFESETEKIRNFDVLERTRFLDVLKTEGYEKACAVVGVEDKPYSLKKRAMALRKLLQ